MKKLLSFFSFVLMISISAQTFAGGPSSYYKTNPTVGKRTDSPIVIDGNPQEWTSDMLIVQGVANDDARAFRGPHEGPVYDLYQLYASWDDSNLYLMWQITNVSDIVCPEQDYPNSDNGKPWNGDIPFQLAFDIDPSKGTNGLLSGQTTPGTENAHIWGIFNMFGNMEVDKILMFSSKPGVGQPGVFSLNSSGAFDYNNVKLFSDVGVEYTSGDYCVPTEIYGINKNQHTGYVVSDLSNESDYVDFIALGHKKSMDTTYEMKIPLAALGIGANYLENSGIGVMLIATFGQSGTNSLPYDPATFDNASEPYSADESTSKEKEDVDEFTASFARIGAGEVTSITRPTLSVSPAGGVYVGGTTVTLSATGEKTPINIYYTLDGTAPSSSSTLYESPIQIVTNNTTLKAVAIDADAVSSFVASHTYITEEPPAPTGIKVSLKKPDTWSTVYIWAWTEEGDLFSTWPGVEMTLETTGWYSYVFDESLTSVNVVFSNNGTPQTVDIEGITGSVCYEQDGEVDGKMTVKVTDCPPLTGINSISKDVVRVYPNPAQNFISIETGDVNSGLSIYSLQGRLLKSIDNYSSNEKLNISNLAKGSYVVKVMRSNGTLEFSKFIKE